MRKKIIVSVIAALCLFVSASPWEGAAATAPEGELPGNGRYIATNSFPRNTVVDIVNIETNKSTRVIVARNLDSPGLLAIVSREAAELIGMRPGSVSRIRMTQPSDPVAYVRFTEGLASGITDYDSGDVITEEKYNEEFVNPSTPPSAVSVVPPAVPPAPSPLAMPPDTGYPAYVLEPEWGGAKSRRDIVDLPPVYVPPEKKTETPASVLTDNPDKLAETEPKDAEITDENPDKLAETEPEDAGITDENPDKLAETEPEDAGITDENPEKIAETGPADAVKKEETTGKTDDFFLEDEDGAVAEYVPDVIYDDFIKEPDEEIAAEDADKDNHSAAVPDTGKSTYVFQPTDPRPPQGVNLPDPDLFVPGIKHSETAEIANKSSTVNEPRVETGSSIRVKPENEMFGGSYYVQLAAFTSLESLENSISRINQNYMKKFNPFVYKDGDQQYHVLLGPLLNLGEGYAVLQRFKSYGYNDAFVCLYKTGSTGIKLQIIKYTEKS